MNLKMNHPPYIKEMIGKKYGKLLVSELLPWEFKSGRKQYFVRCICDCGESTITNALYIKQGNKTHCGCVPPKLSGFHQQRLSFNN